MKGIIVESTQALKQISDYYLKWDPLQMFIMLILVIFALILLITYMFYTKRKYVKHTYELAFIDPITKLWNSNRFEEAIPKAIKEAASSAIVAMDINHFNVINDNYGRETGNKVINFVGQELKKLGIFGVKSARVKADHFLLFLPYGNEKEITQLISTINANVALFQEEDRNIKISCNYGVYIMSDKEVYITKAIDFAETARRETQKENNKSIVFFDMNIENRLRREKEIEDSMESALEKGEFHVYYQPKFDMRDNSIIGAEALVRWISPDKGFLNPAEFIPIFERNGFIINLDAYVLEQACSLMRTIIDEGQRVFPISVNQSRMNFKDERYYDRLKSLIEKYRIPKRIIEIELTETLFSDKETIMDALQAIHELGLLVSVDDFGSGYSSLNLLNSVHADILKIDKNFLNISTNSVRTRTIIKKVVEMAKELHMEVICEGVEYPEQAEFLLSVACNNAQGFLYARPMPQIEFMQLIGQKS